MASLEPFTKKRLIKVTGEQVKFEDDILIVEHQINVYINNEFFTSLYATPKNLKELCVGHLVNREKITCKEDIVTIELTRDQKNAYIQLSQSPVKKELPPIEKPMLVKIPTIYAIMDKHLQPSELFTQTGGVHSIGIFDHDTPVAVMQDVARHNAVDKAIGHCLLSGIDFRDKILVVSGRFSYDMLSKACTAGIPMILCKSAPSSLSVEKADKAGMTLVGFIRGERMNVYTHPERVDLGEEVYKDEVKKNDLAI